MNSLLKEHSSILKCNICLQPATKAKMCLYCSKIGCHECLKGWFEDSNFSCPFCQKETTLAAFADCGRFMNEIKQKLNSVTEKKSISKDLCPHHQIEMRYYCETCKTPFCSDCNTFDKAHQNHKLSLLGKLEQSHKQKIHEQLKKFQQKSKHYLENGIKMKAKFDQLNEQKNAKKYFLEAYLKESLDQLDKQFTQKQALMDLKLESIDEERELLISLKQTLVTDLKRYSSVEIINRSDQLIQLIGTLCNRNLDTLELDYIPQISEFPEYSCYIYELKNFSNIKAQIIFSEGYILNGIEWRLKVYPKGNKQSTGKFLSVFLQMTNAYQNKKEYEYKIQLVNQMNQSESLIRQYVSIFDIGQCWGYNQFIDLNLLDAGYLQDDRMVFKIFIRPKGYKNQAIDQQNYIRKLQSQIKQIKKQIEIINPSRAQFIDRKLSSIASELIKKSELKLQEKRNSIKKAEEVPEKLIEVEKEEKQYRK